MNNYDALLKALVTVIVRYYLSKKSSNILKQENSLVDNILQKKDSEIESKLGQFIIEATSEEESIRRSLHEYILFTAISLKKHMENPKFIPDNEGLTHFQKQLLQFLLTIQLLAKTSQKNTVDVNYNGKNRAVYGLQNGIFTASLCTSGIFLKEILFEPLQLTFDTDKNHLKQTVLLMDQDLRIKTLCQANILLENKNEQLERELLQEKRNLSDAKEHYQRVAEELNDRTEKLKVLEHRKQALVSEMMKEKENLENAKKNYEKAEEELQEEWLKLTSNLTQVQHDDSQLSKKVTGDESNLSSQLPTIQKTNESKILSIGNKPAVKLFWSPSKEHGYKVSVSNPLRFMTVAIRLFARNLEKLVEQIETRLQDEIKEKLSQQQNSH
ncbi:hypothetical protein [Legionella londiniensis]|uniref:Uncharacterized protein n=1 Tax=Legionella londiniensis TaxID=45068 RepID=A0A0W0VII0_9GAMM|nr:hypothetical protein [Legionella londiniensis]KTD19911.1 hypothetical protein Llon_2083 [Legionella londiniensis]STX94217.1 Uncharacterised protein [Legionella londiniensis]